MDVILNEQLVANRPDSGGRAHRPQVDQEAAAYLERVRTILGIAVPIYQAAVAGWVSTGQGRPGLLATRALTAAELLLGELQERVMRGQSPDVTETTKTVADDGQTVFKFHAAESEQSAPPEKKGGES